MPRYKPEKHGKDSWKIWEYDNGFKRLLCIMTADDILKLFNETVPRTIEEPFLEGNPDCNHAWRIWGFNDTFLQCDRCPAMKKIKRLVPRTYDND